MSLTKAASMVAGGFAVAILAASPAGAQVSPPQRRRRSQKGRFTDLWLRYFPINPF